MPPKNNKPWQFQPGVCPNPSGRPKGTRNASTILQEAIAFEARKRGKHLLAHAVQVAYTNPMILSSVMQKLVPNKTEISFGQEELGQATNRILEVVTRHVSRVCGPQAAEVLNAIASELQVEPGQEEVADA